MGCPENLWMCHSFDQGQAEQGFEQPDLAEGVPSHVHKSRR